MPDKLTPQVPQVGSKWRHYNGNEYEVVLIANLHSIKDEYPITLVYRGANLRVWSRPLSDWHRSMATIEDS